MEINYKHRKNMSNYFQEGGNVTQNDHLFFSDSRLNLLENISYLGLTLSSRGKFAQTRISDGRFFV